MNKENIFTRWQDPTIEKLRQEKDQLQNNWNELKKFINSGYYDSYIYSSTILNKMQELEGENNNEEKSNSE